MSTKPRFAALFALAALGCVAPAFAQVADDAVSPGTEDRTGPDTSTSSTRVPARAPLADPAALEPAVDFGGAPAARMPRADQAQTGVAAPRSAEAPAAARAPAAPAASSPRTARAIDSLDLGTTSITGNQELPKVLYIVPWKRSDLGDLAGRPVNTLLDEVLAPIDPEVFERHLDYYESLYGESQEE